MDSLLFEQHLRSPLRFFPDSMLAQFATQDNESASAVLLEKARQHLQMFGRPYPDLLLPQMYQRPPPNFPPLNLGLWQNQLPSQISAGFLSAAAFANAMGDRQQPPHTIPSPMSSASPLQIPANLLPAPQATATLLAPSSSSSDSSSPDLRVKNFARFSPYPLPAHHQQRGQQSSPNQNMPPTSRHSPN